MKKLQLTAEQKDWLAEIKGSKKQDGPYGELGFWTGLDYAILGLITRCSDKHYVLYSRQKLIEIFMSRDKMTWEEADEWVTFNIEGAYVGKLTPFMVVDEMPSGKIKSK